MLYEILYHRTASWVVGETKSEREARMVTARTITLEEQYPDHYDGKIISMRPVGVLPSLVTMSDNDHLVVVLDLDALQVAAVASHRMKIVDNVLASITFDDRWGAVAIKLRESHSNPEQWEIDDSNQYNGIIATNEKRIHDYEAAIIQWKIESDAAIAASVGSKTMPPPLQPYPEKPILLEVKESVFDKVVIELMGTLPETVTHTGTGLYCVKATPTKNDDTQSGAPAGQVITLVTGGLGTTAFVGGYVTNMTRSETRAIVSHSAGDVTLEGDLLSWVDTDDLDIYDAWSTGSAGLAQLETDQGTGAFTSEQELRFYEGTYNETIALSLVLAPRPEYYFVISGAVGETATIAGGASFAFQFDSSARSWVRFENLTISSTSTDAIRAYSWLQGWIVKDCIITAQSNAGIRCHASQRAQFVIINCIIDARYPILYSALNLLQGCTIIQQGGSVSYAIRPAEVSIIQGCTFIAAGNTCAFIILAGLATRLSNCTFESAGYSNVIGIRSLSDEQACRIFSCNNIFHDLTAAYYEDTNSLLYIDSDYNCFEGNTNLFESEDNTDYSTLAAWKIATVLDWGDAEINPDANSIDDDPLMADPGAGDFSLQANSPCRHAGVGSGVPYDVDGNVFDPYHPDIGAVSTGIGPNTAVGS